MSKDFKIVKKLVIILSKTNVIFIFLHSRLKNSIFPQDILLEWDFLIIHLFIHYSDRIFYQFIFKLV